MTSCVDRNCICVGFLMTRVLYSNLFRKLLWNKFWIFLNSINGVGQREKDWHTNYICNLPQVSLYILGYQQVFFSSKIIWDESMRVLRYDEKDHLVTQLIQAYLPTILGFNITQLLTVVTNSEMSSCTKVEAAKNIKNKKKSW